jgi:hypothetical protein
MERPDPIIIKKLFDNELYYNLRNILQPIAKSFDYHIEFGRWRTRGGPGNILDGYAMSLLPLAKKIFNNNDIMFAYSAFVHYEGPDAKLIPHKDDNACTYTIDMCLYQTEPWDIYIQDKPYRLQENEAVAFYANDQKHWRNKFPNPDEQKVGMVFFHYVDPDHWCITKGKDYINVIRGIITKEEYYNA